MSFAEQLTRLQAFLDADELHDEALDYVAAHGYLTALSICSDVVPDREWIDALFSEEPHYSDAAQREEIESTLLALKAHIGRQLASDEEFELPCDLARRRPGRLRTARLVHRFHGRRVPA